MHIGVFDKCISLLPIAEIRMITNKRKTRLFFRHNFIFLNKGRIDSSKSNSIELRTFKCITCLRGQKVKVQKERRILLD